jgi:hypothetical protein
MDEGSQAPLGFQLHRRADLEANARKTLMPLTPLGAAGVSLDASFDEDHAPFLVVGVPAFSLRVEPGEYDIHHHAMTDTFDKVDPRLLAIDTAVMGVAAWSFADAANPVGRRLSEVEAEAVMNKGPASELAGLVEYHKYPQSVTDSARRRILRRGSNPPAIAAVVRLLASQRFGGIDAEAASGGAERREGADEQHERGRAGEYSGNRQAADLFDRHVPTGEVAGEDPRSRTGTDLPERAPEHSRHQTARRGAQCRTDTDLAPALRDDERHERVEAGGRE